MMSADVRFIPSQAAAQRKASQSSKFGGKDYYIESTKEALATVRSAYKALNCKSPTIVRNLQDLQIDIKRLEDAPEEDMQESVRQIDVLTKSTARDVATLANRIKNVLRKYKNLSELHDKPKPEDYTPSFYERTSALSQVGLFICTRSKEELAAEGISIFERKPSVVSEQVVTDTEAQIQKVEESFRNLIVRTSRQELMRQQLQKSSAQFDAILARRTAPR